MSNPKPHDRVDNSGSDPGTWFMMQLASGTWLGNMDLIMVQYLIQFYFDIWIPVPEGLIQVLVRCWSSESAWHNFFSSALNPMNGLVNFVLVHRAYLMLHSRVKFSDHSHHQNRNKPCWIYCNSPTVLAKVPTNNSNFTPATPVAVLKRPSSWWQSIDCVSPKISQAADRGGESRKDGFYNTSRPWTPSDLSVFLLLTGSSKGSSWIRVILRGCIPIGHFDPGLQRRRIGLSRLFRSSLPHETDSPLSRDRGVG